MIRKDGARRPRTFADYTPRQVGEVLAGKEELSRQHRSSKDYEKNLHFSHYRHFGNSICQLACRQLQRATPFYANSRVTILQPWVQPAPGLSAHTSHRPITSK